MGRPLPAERTRRYQDFIQVNDIIGRTVDAVQDTVVEAFTPGWICWTGSWGR